MGLSRYTGESLFSVQSKDASCAINRFISLPRFFTILSRWKRRNPNGSSHCVLVSSCLGSFLFCKMALIIFVNLPVLFSVDSLASFSCCISPGGLYCLRVRDDVISSGKVGGLSGVLELPALLAAIFTGVVVSSAFLSMVVFYSCLFQMLNGFL